MRAAKLFTSCLALPLLAQASAVYITPAGSTVSDGLVNASATFSLLNNTTLQITLTDNLTNPTSVGQLPSDLQFSVSGITGLSLTSMSGTAITINGDNSSTTGGTITTGWVEGTSGSTFVLCVVCASGFPATSAPAELIIGPGPYSNANGSIAGNGPHNPFLNQSATFMLNVTGITPGASLSNVAFSFGTTLGSNVDGALSAGTPVLLAAPTPEPGSATLAIFALGILGCILLLRHRRRERLS